MAGRYEKRAPCRKQNALVWGRDTILNNNMLKILAYCVQQNASYPQMYPQKILLPLFALLMAWAMHTIQGDFRQGERAFFEVAPCCHHRNQQPTCLNTRGPESVSGPCLRVGALPSRCCRQGSHFICYPSCPAGTACHVYPKIAAVHHPKKEDRQGKEFSITYWNYDA